MFTILAWLVFGLIVGLIAKALHPGDDPVGFLPTIGIGVAGSFIGGAINWVIGRGQPFGTAGMLMSIIGGVLFCWIYRRYRLSRFFESQRLKAMKKDDED